IHVRSKLDERVCDLSVVLSRFSRTDIDQGVRGQSDRRARRPRSFMTAQASRRLQTLSTAVPNSGKAFAAPKCSAIITEQIARAYPLPDLIRDSRPDDRRWSGVVMDVKLKISLAAAAFFALGAAGAAAQTVNLSDQGPAGTAFQWLGPRAAAQLGASLQG